MWSCHMSSLPIPHTRQYDKMDGDCSPVPGRPWAGLQEQDIGPAGWHSARCHRTILCVRSRGDGKAGSFSSSSGQKDFSLPQTEIIIIAISLPRAHMSHGLRESKCASRSSFLALSGPTAPSMPRWGTFVNHVCLRAHPPHLGGKEGCDLPRKSSIALGDS